MNYGEDNRKYRHRAQHKMAVQLMGAIPDAVHDILDAGCGMGEFSDAMDAEKHTVARVDGSDHCVAYNRNNGHECAQIDFESGTLPFADAQFDTVISLDVIEHLWNTDHYLSELRRVTKTGGYVILSTPNYNYIRYRMLCLMGRFDSFTYGSRHKKFFTTNSFKRLLMDRVDILKIVGVSTGGIQIKHGLNLFAEQIGILGRFK